MSFRFAFLMIDEMALWHREGMFVLHVWRLAKLEDCCSLGWCGGFIVLVVGVGRFFVRGVCGRWTYVDLSVGGVAEFC